GQAWLGTGVDPGLRRVDSRQAEGSHPKPLRADEHLNWAKGKTVLVHGIGDGQRLPAVDVLQGSNAILAGGQRRINRGVTGVRVRRRVRFEGAIEDKIIRKGDIDGVADARRS